MTKESLNPNDLNQEYGHSGLVIPSSLGFSHSPETEMALLDEYSSRKALQVRDREAVRRVRAYRRVEVVLAFRKTRVSGD